MTGIEDKKLLVRTAYEPHCGFGLWQGTDVISFARNVKYRAGNP